MLMMTMFRIRRSIWFGLIVIQSIFSTSCSLPLDEIDINEFLQLESNMILKLRNYVSQERGRLNKLEVHLQDWKEWRKCSSNQEAQYITIPQNLFHLFKTLTLDLDEIKKFTLESKFNNSMILHDIEPPTDDQLRKAIMPLIDLQYQYDLKAEDIMDGTLMSITLNTSLTLDSCYFIGKTCSEYNNHRCAADWLKVCLSISSNRNAAIASKINQLLCPSYIFLNMTELAEGCVFNYLMKQDYFDTSFTNIAIETGSKLGRLTGRFKDALDAHKICREDTEKPIKSNLKCRYNRGNSAFLQIAPLKEEELYDAPKILYYRDVLHDSEIEFIKATATKDMNAALLHGTSNPTFSQRVTESAFIDTYLPPLDALEHRAEDISGMSIYFSEAWQVLNYSPGGFYATHNDYLPPDEKHVIILGNRLTTMLFYMNEVTLGGETIFPRIGVSVKPTKGSVLVWNNIHADGSGNHWTDHSACPVIIGEKWAFTKWIRMLKNQQCLLSIYESDMKILKSSSNTKTY